MILLGSYKEFSAIHSIFFELSKVERWVNFNSRWVGFTDKQYTCIIDWIIWVSNTVEEIDCRPNVDEWGDPIVTEMAPHLSKSIETIRYLKSNF